MTTRLAFPAGPCRSARNHGRVIGASPRQCKIDERDHCGRSRREPLGCVGVGVKCVVCDRARTSAKRCDSAGRSTSANIPQGSHPRRTTINNCPKCTARKGSRYSSTAQAERRVRKAPFEEREVRAIHATSRNEYPSELEYTKTLVFVRSTCNPRSCRRMDEM